MSTTTVGILSRSKRLARGVQHLKRAPEVLACAAQLREWLNVTLAYLGVTTLQYPFSVSFRNGDRMRLDSFHDLVTLWVVFFRREYSVPTDCTSIIDAGANIGTFSLYAARRAPNARIHALEPFPSTTERLRETLNQNQLEGVVTVHPIGLSGGEETQYMQGDGPSQSRGTMNTPTPNGIAVATESLSHFLDNNRLDAIDLLKMDIEGGEHAVFATTSPEVLRRVRHVALEYHPNGSRDLLFERLAAAGFKCTADARSSANSGVAHFELDASDRAGSEWGR